MWLWDKDDGDESFVRILIAEEINLQIYRAMTEEHIASKPAEFYSYYE